MIFCSMRRYLRVARCYPGRFGLGKILVSAEDISYLFATSGGVNFKKLAIFYGNSDSVII